MYSEFAHINGEHPWRSVSTEGYVDYHVRYRSGGRVLHFNYDLAKEMELIPKNHVHRMNAELEEVLLQTFSLQIINEYDRKSDGISADYAMYPNPRMATRYLQLQHRNKQGRTSGDGRSIWNGCLSTARMVFDISSRGTGATRLSPGAQETDVPIRTGDENVGYASGRADVDEMLGSAIMSEIFYRRGIPTERSLVVIDFSDGSAIGVRVAPNLIRPAHLFRYLKMGHHRELKASVDYFIARQQQNGIWKLPQRGQKRYLGALDLLARTYGRLSALLEDEYIFTWLAWDGDNLLASGALLDYGSVRQFAARHDKYRYEDVDRYSSSLGEQRYWSRQLVQVFAQAMDYIITGEKRNLREFADADCIEVFDVHFQLERDRQLLWRMGFSDGQCERLMKEHRREIDEFRRAFDYFERLKVAKGLEDVPDGITHFPVFLMRNLLRELPGHFLAQAHERSWSLLEPERFCELMAASYVKSIELELNPYRIQQAEALQAHYLALVRAAGKSSRGVLKSMARRSGIINYEHRMTGDGLTWIINEAIKLKDRLDRDKLQEALGLFIESQVLLPGKWKPLPESKVRGNSLAARFLKRTLENLELYKETI